MISTARLRDAHAREVGQALAEYGLLLALIAVACVTVVAALSLAISGILGGVVGSL
jgi:Flp pilus assembly pilin Flp